MAPRMYDSGGEIPFATGTKALIVPTTEDASYGARFDPNLKIYNWTSFDSTSPWYKQQRPWVAGENDPVTFFETAVSTNNSVFLDGGGDKVLFKLGYTRNEEKGILPNSRLLKNMVNFGANYKVSEKVNINANLNMSKIDGKGRYGTGYSKYNINQSFRQWWQTNVDVKELKDAYFRTGRNITWNWADPTKSGRALSYLHRQSLLHPIRELPNGYTLPLLWYRQYQLRCYQTGSTCSAGSLSILMMKLEEERIASGSVSVSSYSRSERTFREYNYDLMANFNKDINPDLNLRAVVGTNIRRNNVNSSYAITNGGLVNPKGYFLANSLNPVPYPYEVAAAHCSGRLFCQRHFHLPGLPHTGWRFQKGPLFHFTQG